MANTTILIFVPEPYPCYPFNPWFFGILKICFLTRAEMIASVD
jgi:hypothetical protein